MTDDLAAEVPPAASGVGRASALLASGTIVSRVLGFISAAVLANTIGLVSGASNTFTIANQLPNNIYAIIAGGLLSAVLVPQIVRAARDEDGGTRFINRVVTLGVVVFLAVTLIAVFFAPQLVDLYSAQQSSGSTRGLTPDELRLATAFAYWCLPQIFFYALYSLLGEVLNARRVFGPFTWAPVVNNLVAIAGLLLFDVLFSSVNIADSATWTPGMIALIAGTATLGVAAQALFLVLFWRRAGLRYRPEFRWRGVGLGKVGKAAFWTFGMILITQVAGVIQSSIASQAGSGNASNTVLRYAWLIFMLPHGIITVSIATPYFTRMSGDAHRGDFDGLRRDLSGSLRTIGLLLTFAAVALMVVAGPVSTVFSSNQSAAHAMAVVILAYVAGLLPFGLIFVLQRTFYALEDTRTPFIFQAAQSVLLVGGMLISATFPQSGIALGIAASTTVADWIIAVVVAMLLRRRLHGLGAAPIIRSYVIFTVALIPTAAAGIGLDALLGAFSGGFALAGKFEAIVSIVVIGLGMAVVYFGVLRLMRSRDLTQFVEPVARRLRARG